MVYPVFEYESIEDRCKKDILTFCDSMKIQDNTKLVLYNPNSHTNNTKESLADAISHITNYLNTHLNNESYLTQISHISPPLQYQLWIARTYLFYQLLIYATATFLDEALYNTDTNLPLKPEQLKNT